MGLSDVLDYRGLLHRAIVRNVSLFTPGLLDEINQVVVRAGHRLQELTPGQASQARCDSTALWLVWQQ